MLRPIALVFLVCGALLSTADDVAKIPAVEAMIERTIPLKTHSISAPYVDSDLQNRWWDFGADTLINTNKYIRLTQDRPSQTGWLWSRLPLSVTDWQVEVEFSVDGKSNNLFGDGFAIWLTKDRAQVGPVFGSADYFTGLGIFFDTYSNSRHSYQWPRVTAMLGDGKTQYDHDHDNEAHELAACSENFRRRDSPTKARLTYVQNRYLTLQLQTKGPDMWSTCFQIEQTLPAAPYLGFSALTGDVHDSHDIVTVSTSSVVLAPQYRDQDSEKAPNGAGQTKGQAKKKSKPKKKSSRGDGAASWFLFILKLIGVGAFIAFAVAAYRTFDAQKRSKRAW